VVRHVAWFLGAVENFRFFDLKVHAFADPEAAVAEVKAEASRATVKIDEHRADVLGRASKKPPSSSLIRPERSRSII
jgi:hypothetical protein